MKQCAPRAEVVRLDQALLFYPGEFFVAGRTDIQRSCAGLALNTKMWGSKGEGHLQYNPGIER